MTDENLVHREPLNVWSFADLPVYVESLAPTFCRQHKEPQQMVLKQLLPCGRLCKACPIPECFSVYPLEKSYIAEYCEKHEIRYLATPCAVSERDICIFRPTMQDVDWKTVTTKIMGFDLKQDHEKLLQELKHVDKVQHPFVQKMNELQQAVISVKETVEQTLNDAHEKEIKRLQEIDLLKKELEEVRKRKKRKHEDEKESPKKKQKQDSASKSHCTPPDEESFRTILFENDPLMRKVVTIAKHGQEYKVHHLRCKNRINACCTARAKILYNPNDGYTYQQIEAYPHTEACLQQNLDCSNTEIPEFSLSTCFEI